MVRSSALEVSFQSLKLSFAARSVIALLVSLSLSLTHFIYLIEMLRQIRCASYVRFAMAIVATSPFATVTICSTQLLRVGHVEGHAVIVDDLVQTGGTLLECAKALRAKGCMGVSCFVTHAVFPNAT